MTRGDPRSCRGVFDLRVPIQPATGIGGAASVKKTFLQKTNGRQFERFDDNSIEGGGERGIMLYQLVRRQKHT